MAQAIDDAKPDAILSLQFGTDLLKFVREGNTRGIFKNRFVVASKVVTTFGMSISSVMRPTGRPAENTPIRSEVVSTKTAGQPPSLLPLAGVMRRPQKANPPLSVANGKGERLAPLRRAGW